MLKKGYKQTEVGVIPEDWTIGELKSIVIGELKYGINAAAIPYNSNYPQYLRITDITEDGRFSKKDRTSVKVLNLDSYWLHINDIVFARTGASTGKTYLYKERDGDMVYAGFLIKACIDTSKAEPAFIYYQFHTNRYWNWVATISQRSGQPGINSKEYSSFYIILPKLEEQKAIATALSDVDNLIDSLEKLIEKKKKIKQGTMQELLTGKNQSTEWRTVLLNEIGTFKKGAGINRAQSQTGEIPAVRYGEIYTCHNYYIKKYYSKISQVIAENSVKVTYGDILFTCSGETKEDIGKCVAIKDKFDVYAGGDLIIMTPNTELNPVFMGYLLNLPYVVRQKALKAQGDAVVHISLESISNIEIKIPSIDEQNALASVLIDMDKEIEQLEKKLAKTKLLKQGMMQKLLTGEIRLLK